MSQNHHNIIMLGGRRAGKSTILSSIIYALSRNTAGNLFTVIDKTEYSSNTDDTGGVAVRLRDKRNEMTELLKRRAKIGSNANFLVDMTPTKGENTYSLELAQNGSHQVYFDFIDVPGEYMEDGKNLKLRERLNKCDVFIIAIDTPYMMQDDEGINDTYNRVEEITSMMSADEICGDELDRKLIVFCPVKCEKWVRMGQAQLVTERVCKTYHALINRWVNHGSHSIEFLVMPIQTVGGMEHVRMLDGYKCYSSDSDKMGERCSRYELTGQVFFGDGTIKSEDDCPYIEEDKELLINKRTIPLSWYKVNGAGFAPENSEQPAYHILRFLVNKHLRLLEAKNRERRSSIWNRIKDRLNGSPFEGSIDVYRNIVDELERSGKIKLGFDGFVQVTEIV